MTVHQKVLQALKPIGIPVKLTFSDDEKEEYFTFDIIDDRCEATADDEPVVIISYLQIHYVAPIYKDYLALQKATRKALLAAGFTYPTITNATSRGDKIRHIVFECSIENEYEMEE